MGWMDRYYMYEEQRERPFSQPPTPWVANRYDRELNHCETNTSKVLKCWVVVPVITSPIGPIQSALGARGTLDTLFSRRARTAAASPCSTGTVCAKLMHASVTDTPCFKGWPGMMS